MGDNDCYRLGYVLYTGNVFNVLKPALMFGSYDHMMIVLKYALIITFYTSNMIYYK